MMSNVCMYTESSVVQESAADAAEHSEQLDVEPDDDTIETTDRPSQDCLTPYLCPVCNKFFASKYYLKLHRKSHTEDLYSCSKCDRCFSFQSSLIQHMNIHAGKYKCLECGKCCHSNYSLIKHRQSHSKEKLIECNVSTKQHNRDLTSEKSYLQPQESLGEASNLPQHQVSVECSTKPYHISRKTYSCRHCSNCFIFPGQLRQHLLTSHSEGTLLICYFCQNSFSHCPTLWSINRYFNIKI